MGYCQRTHEQNKVRGQTNGEQPFRGSEVQGLPPGGDANGPDGLDTILEAPIGDFPAVPAPLGIEAVVRNQLPVLDPAWETLGIDRIRPIFIGRPINDPAPIRGESGAKDKLSCLDQESVGAIAGRSDLGGRNGTSVQPHVKNLSAIRRNVLRQAINGRPEFAGIG